MELTTLYKQVAATFPKCCLPRVIGHLLTGQIGAPILQAPMAVHTRPNQSFVRGLYLRRPKTGALLWESDVEFLVPTGEGFVYRPLNFDYRTTGRQKPTRIFGDLTNEVDDTTDHAPRQNDGLQKGGRESSYT